jgi:gluconate 2-dehydrogenase alpha chain
VPETTQAGALPGEGVGGAGVHWNGATWRWLPWDHEPLKLTLARYGRSVIPPDMQLQDWGVTYDELEPYYEKFEYLCGVAGKAGNLRGQKIEGGNVFEGPRQREYPNPPMIQTHAGTLFERAAKSIIPFPPRPPTCRNPTSIPTASRSAPATIAAIASASAVR